MDFEKVISSIIQIVEATGIVVILIGGIYASVKFLSDTWSKTPGAYEVLRRRLGQAIILGLEFLVAGDIIFTVTLKADVQSVLGLGLLIIIRTFLSFSLQFELQNRLPWTKA